MENIIVPSWPGIHHEETGITFTIHNIDFQLEHQTDLVAWLEYAIQQEEFELDHIDYIFCSDEFLLNINKEHLNHDDYTDIITFPMEENPIVGEIYISVDRVKENAKSFETPFENELRRVMIHGILHLCGYDDHEDEDIEEIRQKENYYLELFQKI